VGGIGWFADAVKRNVANDQLKGVARSFYLSLRLLPAPMRDAAGLGYLLARTSDTLADTPGTAPEARLLCLDWFSRSLAGDEEAPRWPLPVLNALTDPRERRLLEHTPDLLGWLARLPAAEAALVRGVVSIIISGQKSDIERFAGADRQHPAALASDADLEDYTWRVAGCVGRFWTELGFLTLGNGFSSLDAPTLTNLGIRYGKGLQLVNILRDLPADLADGRCYLPVPDPHDEGALMDSHAHWLQQACEWVAAGPRYAETLATRRLRTATALPAMIATETLARLRASTWQQLQQRIKVPRHRIYLLLAKAVLRA
jgi:farnesyl-diphosphate farnesyltransferase